MSTRRRVLLCTGEFPPDPATGGIGTALRAAAAALAPLHDVHVLHVAPGLTANDRDDAHGFVVHERPLGRLLGLVGGRLGLAQALAFRRHAGSLGSFDVVEACDWEASVAGFVVARRQPVVANLFTPTEVIRAHGSSSGSATRARIERWACRRADAVASSGPTLSAELVRRGWFDAVADATVMAPCLDPEALDRVVAPLSPAPVVLGVGRLEPRKGFELVIDALAQVPGEPELVLVGRDVELAAGHTGGDELRRRAVARGVRLRVESPRPSAELEPLFDESWALVVPSTFESFSMAALEAAARGRAVIGTDSIGFVELAADDAGVQRVERTAGAFAAALAPLLGDREVATELGLAARRNVLDRFDPGHFAATRSALYEELVSGSRRGSTIADPSTDGSS